MFFPLHSETLSEDSFHYGNLGCALEEWFLNYLLAAQTFSENFSEEFND